MSNIVALRKVDTRKVIVKIQGGNTLQFYLDIFESISGEFVCEISRRDTYRLQPTFKNASAADEVIFVEDAFFEITSKTYDSPSDVVDAFLVEIRGRLSGTGV